MRSALASAAALAAAPAFGAVTEAEVAEFTAASRALHAAQGNEAALSLPEAAQATLARCILERFEAERGAGGKTDLLIMLDAAANADPGDDDQIAVFDRVYGNFYDETVETCVATLDR
ncbi:MAG: hypothetical protein AAGE18_12180 [Pseudomonadota bacterium]